jgi:hypothetical protein
MCPMLRSFAMSRVCGKTSHTKLRNSFAIPFLL